MHINQLLDIINMQSSIFTMRLVDLVAPVYVIYNENSRKGVSCEPFLPALALYVVL